MQGEVAQNQPDGYSVESDVIGGVVKPDSIGGDMLQSQVRVPTLPPPPSTIAAMPGVVTQQIGSGEHAQNSIVYQTIQWSFVGGGGLSLIAIGVAVWQGEGASALAGVKDVWNIFSPLITLALGYLFGKGK